MKLLFLLLKAPMKPLAAFVFLLALVGCGSEPKINPEEYFLKAEAQAKEMDAEVGKHLAQRSLPGYTRGAETWDAQVGYVDKMPAVVKFLGAGSNKNKMWIYLDTANGKPLFMKEENRNTEGKGAVNRFAYTADSLIMGITGTNPYVAESASDFRTKAAEVAKLASEAIAAVEADRSDLPKGANDARRENAQFYAFGANPAWTMTINPSIKKVYVTLGSPENKIFNYAVPATGPMGETLYDFMSMNDKLSVTIVSKWCRGADGKAYPYTVQAKLNGQVYTGCGVLLQ